MAQDSDWKKAYLDDPTQCPFCQCDQIMMLEALVNDREGAVTTIYCASCKKEWQECYTLTDVIELNEEGELP